MKSAICFALVASASAFAPEVRKLMMNVGILTRDGTTISRSFATIMTETTKLVSNFTR